MTTPVALPPLIGSLHDLHVHLQAALELEHGTIPPYLCALYSLRPGHNRDAAEIIRTVVVQEMLHMVLVANVLNAVGGAPSIAHEAFVPRYPIGLPLGDHAPLDVHLRKFSPETLETFLAIERPAPPPVDMAFFALKLARPVPAGQLAHMVRAGELYHSIGEFYSAVEQGMVALEQAARQRGRSIFTGSADRQVGPEHFYGAGGMASPVVDLATARAAMQVIVRQGEGYGDGVGDGAGVGDEREIAHYYRFDQLRQERRYLPDDAPGVPTGASIGVDYGPGAVFDMIDDPHVAAFPRGEVRDRAKAFARRYTALLQLLDHGLNGHPDRLIESAVTMFDLRRLALDLAANPLPGLDRHAGPCFEYRA